jgi:hypothetical protein
MKHSHSPKRLPLARLNRISGKADWGLPFLFLLWPALAAILAFLRLHRPVPRFVLFAFLLLIGIRYAVVDVRLDGFRLAEIAEEMAQKSLSEFQSWVDAHCFHTETCIDPVQPFYTFFLTRFHDTYNIAFAGYAAVFAAFSIAYAYNIRKHFNFRAKFFCWFFLIAILAQNGIQNIGGFRFNTAVWVLALASYYLFYSNLKLGTVLLVSSIAFHYAMIIPGSLVLILRFARPGLRAALLLLIVSSFASLPIDFLPMMPALDAQIGALSRGARYISEDYVQAIAEQRAQATGNLIFSVYGFVGLKIFYCLWAFYMFIKRDTNKLIGSDRRFLVFAITFLAVASFISVVPSFGRFVNVGTILLLSAILLTAQAYSAAERRWLLAVIVPGLLFNSLFSIRVALGTLDIYAFMPLALPLAFLFEPTPFLSPNDAS